MAHYDELGREIPDSRPVAVPHNWQRPLSLAEQIKRFVRTELSVQADQEGEETWEEADDFEVEDDDPLPLSMYEVPEAVPEAPGGVKDVDPDPPTLKGEKSLKTAKKAVSGDSPKTGKSGSEDEPESVDNSVDNLE